MSGTDQNPENPQKDPNDYIGENKERQKKSRDEAKEEIKRAFRGDRDFIFFGRGSREVKGHDFELERYRGLRRRLEEMFNTEVDRAYKNWSEKRRELVERNKEDLKTLMEDTKEYEARMRAISKYAEAYVYEIVGNEKITHEVLAKMVKSEWAKVSQVLTLVERNDAHSKKIRNALEYALNFKFSDSESLKPELVKELGDTDKEQAFAIIKEYLDHPMLNKYIWTVIAFLDGNEQVELISEYIRENCMKDGKLLESDVTRENGKKENVTKVQALFERGHEMGVVSIEMRNMILERLADESTRSVAPGAPADEKLKSQFLNVIKEMEKIDPKMRALYRKQNDFLEEAKKLVPNKECHNYANEMINLKNILLVVMAIAGGLTIVGNVALSMFDKGKFNLKGLKTLTSNPWPIVGAGEVALAHYMLGGKEKKNNYKDESNENKINYSREMNVRMTSDWSGFFKSENYAGASVFGSFVQELYKKNDESLPEEKLNPKTFMSWLDSKIGSDKTPKEQKEKYRNARKKFIALNKPDQKEYFEFFAKAFNLFQIGYHDKKGSTAETEKRYKYAFNYHIPKKSA